MIFLLETCDNHLHSKYVTDVPLIVALIQKMSDHVPLRASFLSWSSPRNDDQDSGDVRSAGDRLHATDRREHVASDALKKKVEAVSRLNLLSGANELSELISAALADIWFKVVR